jgi:myo-inositol-1(or 4)-monophosphatase
MELKSICESVIRLTKETGEFIRQQAGKISHEQIEVKGKNDFVTYVDKNTEEKLVAALEKILPEAGFITEEKTINRISDHYNWIIDPLDGTTNFIHSLPCYCISIALIRKQTLVLGVIFEINLNECFYAWEASKAYLNGKEISVSKNFDLKNSLLATGFPYTDYTHMDKYLDLFKYLMLNSRGMRRLGSAAVDLAYVACGRFDGFYEYNLNAWDVAAGAFIVQQAGGKVMDFKGGNDFIFGKEIIASNSYIAEECLEAVKKFF